jgi:hypothetical protein
LEPPRPVMGLVPPPMREQIWPGGDHNVQAVKVLDMPRRWLTG